MSRGPCHVTVAHPEACALPEDDDFRFDEDARVVLLHDHVDGARVDEVDVVADVALAKHHPALTAPDGHGTGEHGAQDTTTRGVRSVTGNR